MMMAERGLSVDQVTVWRSAVTRWDGHGGVARIHLDV